MRVVAISDLHIDLTENQAWLETLCRQSHDDEVLLVAGDMASQLELIEKGLRALTGSYREVFFVPGNHDLWVTRRDPMNSLERFHCLVKLCEGLGVKMFGKEIANNQGDVVARIVPLHSWYVGPDESSDSLYLPKTGEDESLSMWADRLRVRWPAEMGSPGDYFLEQNRLVNEGDLPVISFSHFLPRQDLMFSDDHERARFGDQGGDRMPSFNFSRVAGTKGIERQIRTLGSRVHLHGHQHRNRDRVIDGIRYVSHCLGYPQERSQACGKARIVEPVEIFKF